MGRIFHIEEYIRFHDYVRLVGLFRVPGREVKTLHVLHGEETVARGEVNLPAPGVEWNCRFEASCISRSLDVSRLHLRFEFADRGLEVIPCAEHIARQQAVTGGINPAEAAFLERIEGHDYMRVLEIGSRARSGIVRRQLFSGKAYTGMDILPGPNVDVVGDAHELSRLFASASFDALYSKHTFEHLAMPWKVALEVNHVLRSGGLAYFESHQSLGMHDLPWDFWRYSDSAWHNLFNPYSGFTVLQTHLGVPLNLVPHFYSDEDWRGYEAAAGFAVSGVLVEKTGPTSLTWDVDVSQVVKGAYPA